MSVTHLADWASTLDSAYSACPADALGCSDVGVASGSWVPVAVVILAVLLVLVAFLAFHRR